MKAWKGSFITAGPVRSAGKAGMVLSFLQAHARHRLCWSGRALAVWKMNKDCRLSGRPDSFLTGLCCL